MSIRRALLFVSASRVMRVIAQWRFGIRDCRVIWEFGVGIAEFGINDRAVCMDACTDGYEGGRGYCFSFFFPPWIKRRPPWCMTRTMVTLNLSCVSVVPAPRSYLGDTV